MTMNEYEIVNRSSQQRKCKCPISIFKKFSAFLFIMEMNIKTTLRFCFSPVRMTIIVKTRNIDVVHGLYCWVEPVIAFFLSSLQRHFRYHEN